MKQNKLQIIYNFKAQEPQGIEVKAGFPYPAIPGLHLGGCDAKETK